MHKALNRFEENINYVRSLGALYSALRKMTTPALDLTDILRSELVMSVSVLDNFIHELVEEGMVEAYVGNRPPTNHFLKYDISISLVKSIAISSNNEWLRNEIRKRNGYKSYQKPDKISEAIKLISNKNLWTEMSTILERPSEDIKRQLELIVERRNRITHEADSNPTYQNKRWPIDEKMVDEAVNFIDEFGKALFKIVAT